MRQPTLDPYAWHKAALDGDEVVRNPDCPECGWFKRRLVKGGVFVPCRIWLASFTDPDGELSEDERFYCEVGGMPADAFEEWVWLCARPISKREFDYLTAVGKWSQASAPGEPEANPRKPIDWLTVRPPVFNRKEANQ